MPYNRTNSTICGMKLNQKGPPDMRNWSMASLLKRLHGASPLL